MEKPMDKHKIKDIFMMHFAVCPKCNSNIIINEAIQKAKKESQKGMIKIEDVEKMIDKFDILKYIDVEWFKDNWKEGLKQSLKELGEK